MIEFSCPGCLSQCVANGAFSGMKARCVVCGAFIRIPVETGTVAAPLGPVPSGPLPSSPRAPVKPPKPAPHSRSGRGFATADDDRFDVVEENDDFEELEPGDDLEPEEEEDEDWIAPDPPEPRPGDKPKPGDKAKGPAAKTPAKKEKIAGSELDGKLSWEDFPDEPQPEAVAGPTEAEKRKRKMMIYGGSVAASIVIVILILAFSGGEKPILIPPPPPPEQPPPPAPKPIPKEPEKAPPLIPVAPAPRTGGDPIRYMAPQLVAERAVNPGAFDAYYRGQPVLLFGTFSRVAGDVIFLNEGTGPVPKAGTDGIACVSPKVTRKPLEDPWPETKFFFPGQALMVRGWYAGDRRLTDCSVSAANGPVDGEYRDKDIELVGTVATATEPDGSFPTVVLAPPTTDCPLSVRCLFRPTEQERVAALRPGQTVTIRGHCQGRSGRIVRLHNCLLLSHSDPIAAGVARLPAARIFAVYEVGLLPFTRPDPSAPVGEPLSADQIASAYATNPRAANDLLLNQAVLVRGVVGSRDPKNCTIVLETGTEQRYRVLAVFTPARYMALRERKDQLLRGVCAGLFIDPNNPSLRYVRLENAELYDPSAGDSSVRTTAAFVPFRPGQDLTYDMLALEGKKDHFPITRLRMSVVSTEVHRTTLLRSGTFSKASLAEEFGGKAIWTKDLTRQKGGPTTLMTEYRIVDDTVETRDRPAPPALPGQWWDPIFKFGLAKGETWTTTTPDGLVVTYKVVGFGKDASKRDTVDILRTLKNPKNVTTWEEMTSTYVSGIGMVRRVVSRQSAMGAASMVLDMKLVDADLPDEVEPKKEPDPGPADKKDDK